MCHLMPANEHGSEVKSRTKKNAIKHSCDWIVYGSARTRAILI
jgi:hypothetical protein